METLYRKYRSQTFAELVGQHQVIQILRNAIMRNRLSHAYLFCGPRGTGKTSVARIFAKALCCLNPHDGDCCGVCANCESIASGRALDVQEIDAASKNKVDDIRELRDRVGYAPAVFPYKIYIIDEVHMVTSQGFNALLKTLEEPPAHVKFFLCTTEAHKLPLTILSRCLRLDFSRIAPQELAAHLMHVAQLEGFALEEHAALELAALAEGSARDAISLLDQLTVFCDNTITPPDVHELFQLGNPELVPGIVDAVAAGNRRELLDAWEKLASQGADAGRFLLQISGEMKSRYLDSVNPAWQQALNAVWQALNLLKQESFPALLVELALLEAAAAFAAPAPGVTSSRASVATDDQPPTARVEPPRSSSPGRMPAALQQKSQPMRQNEPLPQARVMPAAEKQPTVAERAPSDTNGPTDPVWIKFLAALQTRSLSAYALVFKFAQPALSPAGLRLSYPGEVAWARSACAYLQFSENIQALAQAAAEVGLSQVSAGVEGEDETWKSADKDTARQSTPAGQAASIAGSPASFFERMANVAPKAAEPAADGTEVVEEDFGQPVRLAPDPAALDAAAERVEEQLTRTAQTSAEAPPTIEEAMLIFDAIPLPDEA